MNSNWIMPRTKERLKEQNLPPLISFEEARQKLFGIWAEFWRGGQTPEDSKRRQMVINEYLTSLSPEVDRELTKSEQDQPSILAQVREDSRRFVSEERHREQKEKKELRLSKSQKLNVRRAKAQERRGTDPRHIH